ncbi:MAG: glycosyltransferase family 4 protein [Elusimicrobia bacterium]|nr:glycosyltransferase family 4 protein [Elusimicrobiota bacterium]
MRLAIVCRQVEGLSGTVTTVLEHARRMVKRGWAVDVYGERLDSGAIRAAGAAPRRLLNVPFGSFFKRRLFAWRADRAVEEGYDLVHGHGDGFRQDVLSLHNCVHAAHEAVSGKPLPTEAGVGLMHELQLKERRFRHLIANSKLMRSELAMRFGIPDDQTSVIYPGHDPKRFNPAAAHKTRAEMRRTLNFLETDVVFGLITSGDFVKRGVDVFIHALSRAAPRLRGRFRALVMGKDKHLGPYRKLVVEEELTKFVTFLPPSTEVERFYGALDVYVHPAHYEEFGQSVQEALACGLPVLTNLQVGAAELLAGESREYLLERSTPDALAGQLCVLAGDADLRRRLGALGPRAVSGRTWDDNFAATWAVYEGLLGQASR